MKSNRVLLPLATVGLAVIAGCAAGVRYDDGYGYNNGYGYNDGYGYDAQATAVPPAVDVPPELVVLPGTDIYAAPSVGADLYFVDGYWWRPWNGHWYRSHYGNDWSMVSSAPYFYRSIPHGWREDYYQHRWNGRPWDYHYVSRNEAVTHWNRWKRDRYWHDDRWASSRDRYRRDSATSGVRYDQRRGGTYRGDTRYEDRRSYNDRRSYDDRRDAYAPTDRYRQEPQREASPTRRYDGRTTTGAGTTYGTTYENDRYDTRPAYRNEREQREMRPTSRRPEERRIAPEERRSAPSAPAGTVHRTEQPTRRAPAARPESPHHRVAPAQQTDTNRGATRQTDTNRGATRDENRRGNRETPDQSRF